MLDKFDKTPICHTADIDSARNFKIDRDVGSYKSSVEFPGGILNAGNYSLRISISKKNSTLFDYREAFNFNLLDLGTFASVNGKNGGQRLGVIAPSLLWQCSKKRNK